MDSNDSVSFQNSEEDLVEQSECSVKKTAILVEYPGQVKNINKCLETLGGLGKISETFENEKRRLEVKFTPKNHFSKSVFGDEHPTTGLLLKVKIPRKRLTKTLDVPSEKVEIVARVDKCYQFTGLCDFQLLPIVKRDDGRVDMVYEEMIPTYKDTYSWLTEKPNVPYFLPPLLFSRLDSVQHKIFKPTMTTEKGMIAPRIFQRKKRSKYNVIASFNLHDTLPERMNPAAGEMLKVKFISPEEFNAVKRTLEDRPICSRMALCFLSKVQLARVKIILPTLAFFFNSGPWRGLWCRFGFDPRKHFEARHFQVLDYRLRNQVGARHYVNRKSTYAVGSVNKVSVSQRKPNNVVQRIRQEEEKDTEDRVIYSPYFEVGKMPEARQINYQYCDIRVPKIQEMLEKLPGPLYGTTCSEKSGWLPPGFEVQCREIMNELLREHFQTEILKREELEESAEEEMSSDEESMMMEDAFEDMDIDESTRESK
ncbi:general transcription factor 3C polypeptide 5 [Lutzomyia longipalpis]|uniref:general transcription factor 3C polypeptide 5 n=1 Tax=Lutzomyia longipalpis TaxID=7200 RepID=UPI0024840CB3|nr:general transcription factor 3C polypeptide 5 [Lutzomyia longipalpis]